MTSGLGARNALIVASYEFEDPKLKGLRAPAEDAEGLTRVLSDSEIGAFEVESSVNEPDWTVRRRISRFFKDRGLDDVLLLHFSSHGLKDDDGSLYFATANTRFDDLDTTAVAADFVNRQMTRSRSRRIVLTLDCCYSGAFGRGMVGRHDDSVHVGESFEGRGRVVLTASNSMEYAFEGDDRTGVGRPSVFTSALVKGLETGEADRDRDSLISVGELYEYVYDQVREETPNQTPSKWTYGEEGTFVIARSRLQPSPLPSPLPEVVVEAVESPLAGVRQGAISELVKLIASSRSTVATAARAALERLTDDDSSRVSDAAKAALADLEASGTSTRVTTLPKPRPKVELGPKQEDPTKVPPPPPPSWTRRLRTSRWIIGVAAVLAALGGILVWLFWPNPPSSAPSPESITWRASPGRDFGGSGHQEVKAVAPLGSRGAIAVGYSSDGQTEPVAWRFDGRAWHREPTLSSERYGQLEAVATHGATVVTAGAAGPEVFNTAAAVWTRIDDAAWQRTCPSNRRGACLSTPDARVSARIWGLASVPGGFVAVGRSAPVGSTNYGELHSTVWTSRDGLEWRTHYRDTKTGAMQAVARSGDGLVAVGNVGGSAMVWLGTADGSTWHKVAPDENYDLGLGNSLYGVAARGSTVVAVGSRAARQCGRASSEPLALQSTDGGATWQLVASTTFRLQNGKALGVVPYSNGFVAVGYGHRHCDSSSSSSFGAAWTSLDGQAWTLDTSAPFFRRSGRELNQGAYVNGGIFVGGDGSSSSGDYDVEIWEGHR